jgi:DNA replication protein DnaC
VPSLNKQQVLQLAQGEYIRQTEPVLFVGNPGLGKTHVATGLALAACRQGYRVRFYNAATLVNELLQAQDEHRLPKFLNINYNSLNHSPFCRVVPFSMITFCSS